VAKTDDRDSQLRSAVFVRDGQHLVAVLLQEPWGDRLQLAGDGLLIASTQGVDQASELASQCASELRARAWEGDGDLAEQLDAVLGKGPAPMLRPLPVDLEELAGILEGDPVYGGGRIDLRTGEVWPQAAIDYARETGEDDPDDEDPDRWLAVWCEGSRDAYRDMADFIETVRNEDRADLLSVAISGRGAFRRFKDLLARWPGELERWYAFSDERQRGRARAWLAAAGYSSHRPERHPSS
jgi:hypothetical protein